MNIVGQILSFVGTFSTRFGLSGFVEKYAPVVVRIVQDLQSVRGNQDFLAWKDKAFEEVKAITGEVKDTWISIVVAAAASQLGEGSKARGWLSNLFARVFGFLSRRAPSLTELLRKYGDPAVSIVQRLLAANTNATFKDIERDAIASLRSLFAELSSSAAGLVINAVFEALKARKQS